jgi:hypothetical protein
MVRESVLDRAAGEDAADGFSDEARMKEWLENLRPEDFGGSPQ